MSERDHGKIPRKLRDQLFQGDVTISVTPEERDYYYNLDFLCGVYKGINHGLELEDE